MSKLQFKGKAIKLCRFGSDNAVKQFAHVKLPSDFRRGVWAFPYPYMEMFYAVHRVKTFLKASSVWNYENPHPDYDSAKSNEDYRIKGKLFKRTMTTFWWDRPFLSRLGDGSHPGCTDVTGGEWWLWTSPKDWADYVSGMLPSAKHRYSKDHLELFCPIKGK